jgi:micrococcal nuclease
MLFCPLIWTTLPLPRSTRGMLFLVAIFAAAFCVSAHAADVQTISARVVGVHDGDTLTALTDDKRQLKVRLHGIDAPELGQPHGQASKRALSDLVFGKQVTLHITGTDRYKRTLARVTVDDIEVDAQMIVTGHAWHYSRYDHTAALEAAERNARAARRGLWADAEPVPPWEWRKQHQHRKDTVKQ